MKTYNNEKAIISLTSWKKRINTVSQTIFSLIKQCPGFHIVLVLSDEEFSKKEEELPEDLRVFIDTDLIEILWVHKNYRSFKKVLFTMDKYKTVPVISADDGCIYTKNYAEELYQEWLKHQHDVICYAHFAYRGYSWGGGGYGILFPPNRFLDRGIANLSDFVLSTNHDDAYYGALCNVFNIKMRFLHDKMDKPFKDTRVGNATALGGIHPKFTDAIICKLVNCIS